MRLPGCGCCPGSCLPTVMKWQTAMIRGQRKAVALTIRVPLQQRPRAEVFADEIQKVKEREDERGGAAAVGSKLDHAERGDAIGTYAAQFAVEIGLTAGQ
jgi:hypothetical protein